MPIETASDRTAFLSTDEFGAVAIYTPDGGTPSSPIAGIFDAPSIDVTLNDAASQDSRATFWCQVEDLPGAASAENEDELAVDGQGAFKVWAIEPDGQGMVLLRLGDIS